MSEAATPATGSDRGRVLWGAVRFALLLVVAVSLVVSFALGGGSGTLATAAAVTTTVAVLAAVLWDHVFQRRRAERVAAGLEKRRLSDPLDLWITVAAFAVLGAVQGFSLTERGAVRWVLVGLCLAAAVLTWASARHFSLWRRDP